ncbi:Clavaminate synthase-like protein [Auriculariales sp. MPI-PUGE-AT-0066]|nr:Clavaminate synthase-like protein [Auriculariales sp. MPI-PUGE-AT-0066]
MLDRLYEGKLRFRGNSGGVSHVGTTMVQRIGTSCELRNERAVHIDGLGSFPYRWLRDSCQCPSCVHPSTRQKLHASSDIPRHVQPAAPVKLSNNALHVRWTGHKMDSVYDRAFLKAYATPVGTREMHGDEHLTAQGWTAAQLEAKPARFVAYEDLRNDPERRLVAFEHLAQTGLLLTSNETCELRQLANVFGEIRHTFYGQTWNVVAKKGSTNIAYTSLSSGSTWTLSTYFAHPPRLQLLHCLRNQVVGELDPTSGAIRQLNYSPPFQAPLPADTPDAVFDALELFANTLEEDGRMFKYLLREGDAAVFDNRRVLHARDSFHDPMEDGTDDGEPMRWLKGCYVEADPLLDRARVLRKEILSNVASS